MGAERVTFDTNILFYALDPDAGEKHSVAHDLLDRALDSDPVLLLQSLAELYNAARKRQTIPLDQVQDFIASNMRALPVVAFEAADLLPAIALQRLHMLQFWGCTSDQDSTSDWMHLAAIGRRPALSQVRWLDCSEPLPSFGDRVGPAFLTYLT